MKKHLVNGCLTDELLQQSIIEGTELYHAVEKVLKGSELTLPNSLFFYDKDGNARNEIRTKWWLNPQGITYKKISVLPLSEIPDVEVTYESKTLHYSEEHKPVFFGHYWLQGDPVVLRDNICCLDYSVAKKGHLVAYSYKGENKLLSAHLTYV